MEEDFKALALAFIQLVEGDDSTEAGMSILRKWEFVDDNDEWIYEDEEELDFDEDDE